MTYVSRLSGADLDRWAARAARLDTLDGVDLLAQIIEPERIKVVPLYSQGLGRKPDGWTAVVAHDPQMPSMFGATAREAVLRALVGAKFGYTITEEQS